LLPSHPTVVTIASAAEANSPPTTQTASGSALPSPLVWPLDDRQRVVDLIVEATGGARQSVIENLELEEQSPGELQRRDFHRYGLPAHVWTDGYEEFYRSTTWGLFGNPVWNRRDAKLRMREWIGSRLATPAGQSPADKSPAGQSLRILMIGDGSGFDSLYLAKCGHQVTYSERQREAVSFARKLFTAAGVAVNLCEDEGQLAEGAFDVVMCLDVMEHVPAPVEFVGWMTKRLRPGGRLIVHAPFFFVSWHYPTHLASNRKYSGDLRRLYKPHGLVLCDGRPFWDPLVLGKPAEDGAVPFRRPLKACMLRLTGLLLAVGRWWSWPHLRLAVRAIRQGTPTSWQV
jgi:SAM-dependent methyltransferase